MLLNVGRRIKTTPEDTINRHFLFIKHSDKDMFNLLNSKRKMSYCDDATPSKISVIQFFRLVNGWDIES